MIYSDIVAYFCGTYEQGNFGGVARYEYTLSLVFPERKFFRGPDEKGKLIKYLSKCKNPVVITDNHLSCDVPNKYPTFVLHHGCALTTGERNPDWGEPWRSLCMNGQRKMVDYRDPKKTIMVSTSISCKVDFERHLGEKYTKFKVLDLLNTTELDENRFKESFNEKPIVLGNWTHVKKGSRVMPRVQKELSDKFDFKQLNVHPSGSSKKEIDEFNKKKQDIYLECDIFLQISSSEGNAFSSLDAMLCGLVIVASDVGKFYADVPEDCFVKMDWRRQDDPVYVKKCLQSAWENRETLSKNARLWYLKECRMDIFKKKWEKLLSENQFKN